jgi:hypothetical protein
VRSSRLAEEPENFNLGAMPPISLPFLSTFVSFDGPTLSYGDMQSLNWARIAVFSQRNNVMNPETLCSLGRHAAELVSPSID